MVRGGSREDIVRDELRRDWVSPVGQLDGL